MRGLWTALPFIIALAFTSAAEATVISVSPGGNGDYRVMQEALDASAPGDTILVKAGFHRDYTELWHGGALRKAVGFVPHSMTIIGESEFAWIEGPAEPGGTGFYSLSTDSLAFHNLQFRGSNHAIDHAFGDGGTGVVRECKFQDLMTGVTIAGIGSRISVRQSSFVRIGFAGVLATVYAHAEVDSSSFAGTHETGPGVCIGVVNRATGTLRECHSSEMELAQVNTEGGLTIDRSSAVDYVGAGLLVRDPSSRLEVSNSHFTGNATSSIGVVVGNQGTLRARRVDFRRMWRTVFVSGSRNVSIQECDFHPGSDRSVLLEALVDPPSSYLDFTNNWWGTTDSLAIAESIWDGNDDSHSSEYGFVTFRPIATAALPIVSTTMGNVKSMFQIRR